jgi:hypothetical protein
MQKTDKMLLIEERAGKDIREVLLEAYAATGTIEEAGAWITQRYGVRVPFGRFHDWVQAGGGRISRTLEFPEWQPAEVSA